MSVDRSGSNTGGERVDINWSSANEVGVVASQRDRLYFISLLFFGLEVFFNLAFLERFSVENGDAI